MQALRFVLAAVLALSPALLSGQEILLDRSLQVGGLTLFAARANPGEWYYLPDRPHLATDERGRPEFSFVKYVVPGRAGDGAEGITRAEGGGVVHLLASYEVDRAIVERAGEALRALEGHEEDRIVGPILYREGHFQLISSIVTPDGRFGRRLLATGNAPLIEGERAAVSMELAPEGASFLWQALDMEHPDLTLVFSMQIAGYRTPYEAEMVVDWDRLWHHQRVKAGLKIYWVGVDVDTLVDELFTDGTIKVTVKGTSAPMEALMQSAYTRAVQLLFEQVPPEEEGGGEAASAGSAVDRILSAAGSAVDRYKVVDITAGYRLRNIRRTGTTRLSLRHQIEVPLFVLLSADIGPVAARHRDDPAFFRVVNLEDPTFRQREVTVTYDGDARSFAEVLNHVVVQLRKRHRDGSVTLREAMLRPGKIAGEHGRIVFTYPNSGDTDPYEWLNYQWRAVWSFRQGFDHDTGWLDADAFAIALRPPFVVRRVALDGDEETLRRAGVRAVTATLTWDVLGHRERKVATVRPGQLPRIVPMVLSRNDPSFSVFLAWHLKGGRKVPAGPWRESSEIVFVDEVDTAPASEGRPAADGGSR